MKGQKIMLWWKNGYASTGYHGCSGYSNCLSWTCGTVGCTHSAPIKILQSRRPHKVKLGDNSEIQYAKENSGNGHDGEQGRKGR